MDVTAHQDVEAMTAEMNTSKERYGAMMKEKEDTMSRELESLRSELQKESERRQILVSTLLRNSPEYFE